MIVHETFNGMHRNSASCVEVLTLVMNVMGVFKEIVPNIRNPFSIPMMRSSMDNVEVGMSPIWGKSDPKEASPRIFPQIVIPISVCWI